MLRITGSRKTLCDGITRRDLLQIGGLSSLGLSLGGFLRLKQAQADTVANHAAAGFGKAKACILIHLFGAPPQHETFDPKPLAPAEIQGEMKAISTSLAGVEIGEGLPQVAQILDRSTVVRSLTHALPFHGVHYAISGIPEISKTVEADPNDRSLWPFIGSVFDYVAEQRNPGAAVMLPRNIAMPYVLYSKCQFRPLGGPYAGFFGSRYDPVWTEFNAKGTRAVPKPLDKADVDVLDPFGGIRPDDKLGIAGPSGIADAMSPERLGLRRALMQQFDHTRRWMDEHERVQSFDRFQTLAWSLVTSSRMAESLDIQKEPAAVREQYGMTLFGQSLLAARRLIQAGGRFMTVFWDAYGHFTGGWDTHYQHYPRLKEFLLPVFDQAFSALILDLESQGLLDETLVLCVSEHGRTPKISTNVKGGGREHWSRVYSGLMAGGGVARGRVVGKSDAIGSDVAQSPVSPKDLLATAFHLLGIDPHMTVHDQQNRPWPIAGSGVVQHELLG